MNIVPMMASIVGLALMAGLGTYAMGLTDSSACQSLPANLADVCTGAKNWSSNLYAPLIVMVPAFAGLTLAMSLLIWRM